MYYSFLVVGFTTRQSARNAPRICISRTRTARSQTRCSRLVDGSPYCVSCGRNSPVFIGSAAEFANFQWLKQLVPQRKLPDRAAAGSQPSPAEFGRLAARLAGDRAGAPAEQEPLQEQALQMLDRVALPYLNSAAPGGAGADPSGRPSAVATLNRTLATFVTRQPPIGEGYRVLPLAANPAIYALIADFGLSGPSAVRLYAGAPGQLALVARIDRYAQKDYFDDYMELVPVSTSAPGRSGRVRDRVRTHGRSAHRCFYRVEV